MNVMRFLYSFCCNLHGSILTKKLSFLLLFLHAHFFFAQVYPVQTTIITAGPYDNNTGNWLLNSYSQTVNYKAESETFTYDLFQDVYIVLNDPNDFSVLSLGSSSGTESLVVPAFYLPLIAQNQIDVYQEELFQNSILAVNIASTALGAGAIYNAYKVGRYGLPVFELINLGVDVMDLTGVSNSVIPSEYQPYVNTFQIALGSYGLFVGKTTKEIAQSSSRPLLDESFVSATIHLRNNSDDLPLDLQTRVGFTYEYLKAKGFINAAGEVVQVVGNSIDITNFYTINKAIESKNLVFQHNLMQYSAGANIDEVSAIHRYTVNNFELTDAAYGGSYSPVQQSWINLIESGLNKIRATNSYTGTVYRGSNLESQFLQPFIDAWQSSSKTLTIPPFQSTSKLESVANSFINRFKAPGKTEVMFEIQSKTGVYIDDISDYGKNLQPIHNRPNPKNMIQEEVILNKGGEYRIDNLSYITNPDGTIRCIIEMTEL